jgi:hypothetical protein
VHRVVFLEIHRSSEYRAALMTGEVPGLAVREHVRFECGSLAERLAAGMTGEGRLLKQYKTNVLNKCSN